MREKILKELKKNEYISGQKIAEKFKISRAAVLKNINALRNLGFKIESAHRKGYKLISDSKKLNYLTVNKCLKTSFIGRPILYFENVASTINQIMLKAQKEDEGLVVVAQRQEKGRGRFKREWSSRKGGI
ncbi:MAG: HTH domain-containing protein, partial [Actinobacteria bacterium]